MRSWPASSCSTARARSASARFASSRPAITATSSSARRRIRRAGRLLAKYGTSREATRSLILIEDDEISLRSTAVLKIARRMTAPWRWAAVFLLVPRPIRDAVYRVVAAIRHRIAGQSNACEIPPPEIRARLITLGLLHLLQQQEAVALAWRPRRNDTSGHVLLLAERLDQPQRRLLPVVLDRLAAIVDRPVQEQLLAIALRERLPIDLAGLDGLQQLLRWARATASTRRSVRSAGRGRESASRESATRHPSSVRDHTLRVLSMPHFTTPHPDRRAIGRPGRPDGDQAIRHGGQHGIGAWLVAQASRWRRRSIAARGRCIALRNAGWRTPLRTSSQATPAARRRRSRSADATASGCRASARGPVCRTPCRPRAVA